MRRSGFTMIEMLMAVLILSVMTIITGVTFNTVVNTWKKATTIAERMQGADYALGQIVAGLRSAYYPMDGNQKDEWGLALYDEGNGEDVSSSDIIEWTKLGASIIGNKSVLAETSHKVRLWVEEARSKDEPGGLWVRVWNPDLMTDEQKEDLEEEEYGEEFLLVEDVVGFDCQVQKTPDESEQDGRPKWEETWDTSNCVPYRVKLSFRMKPPDVRDDPLPLLRVVEIPIWEYSQKPFALDETGADKNKDGKKNDGKGGKGGSNGGNGGKGGGASGGGAGGGKGGGGMPGGGGGMRGGAPMGGGMR